ncbi:hypothetical protein WCX49_02220 [Sulfurimonas sp. HSL-1656]|uniref:hypothetical protein n=1 Tax=Thiomicrolovo subterrani TaxID=3131934 RepID=UPI0031F943B9
MTGEMMIKYIVLCDADLEISVTLADLLQNEAVARAIKNAYAKGKRDIEAVVMEPGALTIKNKKALQTVTIPKESFMDALTLAEEDAKAKKLLKKGCDRIEIVDIETI